jgi:hypothetical protein
MRIGFERTAYTAYYNWPILNFLKLSQNLWKDLSALFFVLYKKIKK